jgi:ribosome-associated toxin RatA of RatAB toxin-antitoxin module
MAKYDVTDEAIINASPDVVYNAVIDEYDGKTSWWMPHLSSKLREGNSCSKVGALLDLTVHGKRPIKFTAKTVEAKNNEMIRVNYVEGAFRGEGLWKFESLEGKTKLSFRWRTSPSGLLLRILAPFLPIEKSHSDVMKAGFNNLNKFLD